MDEDSEDSSVVRKPVKASLSKALPKKPVAAPKKRMIEDSDSETLSQTSEMMSIVAPRAVRASSVTQKPAAPIELSDDDETDEEEEDEEDFTEESEEEESDFED